MAISPFDINFGAQNPTGAYMQQQPQMAAAEQTSGFGVPGAGLTTAATPLGMNLGTAQLALGGIGTLGNLWAAFQAQKLAKEQFNFTKGITNTNLANQIQSYNTALTDKITSRSFTQGDGQAVTDKYIADNSLRDQRNG